MNERNLDKKQFDVLTYLEENTQYISQRDLSKAIGMSLGSVNKIITKLTETEYLKDGRITENGYCALEPYRVKRAVFIAAGFGSRLVPITLNTPKPLVRVKGVRIIDSLLDAIISTGIEEIYIIRGYLGEQFDQLLYKYPMIKFLENPIYNEANNISSMLIAEDLLKNAYICEADLLLYRKELITKYQYSTNYLGIPSEKTDDWCFFFENGRIVKMAVGGENCYQMVGISYWTNEDGQKLSGHIKQVFNSPGGKERYWDQVPLEYFINEYNVGIRSCTNNDIVEIDTFRELKQIDSVYNI